MPKTFIALAGAIVLAVPALAGAQPSRDGDPRIRSVSRIVIEQGRERQRPRVVVQKRDGREEASETFSKTVKLGASGELDISNIIGDIEIKRGGGSEATVNAVKIARARTVDEAKELLPLVKVDVSERQGRVEIRTVYPDERHIFHNRRNVNVHVHYSVTAPAGTRVTARSLAGNIRAAEITGELSLVTTSGDVVVLKGKRVAAAKSTSGRVEISDTDTDTPLEAGSVSGDVVVQRVKASRMELGTVSGKVVIQDVACGRIEAQSLSGDVDFAGQLMKGGRYEFNSHAGNVKVSVSGKTGFEVEANSWSGRIQSEPPIVNASQTGTGRGPRMKALKGVVGDGSAFLEITTFSGSVMITRR